MQDQRHAVRDVRMLLVDDDPDFTRVFQISLRAEKRVSFEIETANTLESALKILPCFASGNTLLFSHHGL